MLSAHVEIISKHASDHDVF